MNIFYLSILLLLSSSSFGNCERDENRREEFVNNDTNVKNYVKENYEYEYASEGNQNGDLRQFTDDGIYVIKMSEENNESDIQLLWNNYKKWLLVSFYKYVVIAYNPWVLTNLNGRTYTRTTNDKRSVQEINYSANGEFVCFPEVGCFAVGNPWKSNFRPIPKPFAPDKIDTTLFFFSRKNSKDKIDIKLYPKLNMNNVKYNPDKPTMILAHGFASSGDASWMLDLKDVYLSKKDANVFLVNWEKGSNMLNYLQVVGNIRVVGKQLGMFVSHLIEKYKAKPKKFHLIGHSLGAHICAYLAKDVPGIGRLTALDPAQPGFEGFDKLVRLDSSDAEFVEVVHTNAKPFPILGFGMMAPYGHVDFYMNGGFEQPGCLPIPKKELPPVKNLKDLANFPVEVISRTITCPHSRAYQFITEAYNQTGDCIFWGRKTTIKNMAKTVMNHVLQEVFGKVYYFSKNRNANDGIPMGFETISSPLRGSFIVTTGRETPFCKAYF